MNPSETEPKRSLEARMSEFIRIGRNAVRKAQEESRRLGVPNVYEIDGVILYEWPDGELRREDPYRERPRDGTAPEPGTP